MNRWGLPTMAILAVTAMVAAGCGGEGESVTKEIQVSVTEKGFEPNEIHVKKGDDVTLMITRRVESTCATEVVIGDGAIREMLPLNQTVRVALGKVERAETKVACGMDMIKGSVVAD